MSESVPDTLHTRSASIFLVGCCRFSSLGSLSRVSLADRRTALACQHGHKERPKEFTFFFFLYSGATSARTTILFFLFFSPLHFPQHPCQNVEGWEDNKLCIHRKAKKTRQRPTHLSWGGRTHTQATACTFLRQTGQQLAVFLEIVSASVSSRLLSFHYVSMCISRDSFSASTLATLGVRAAFNQSFLSQHRF